MTDVTAPTATPAPQANPEPAKIPDHLITPEVARKMIAEEAARKAASPGSKNNSNPVESKDGGKEPSTKDLVKEAAEMAKKYKVKVDGEELEVDENELLRGYSHQRAANKKLQEGLAARKQSEQFLEMMRNPETFYEVAKKLGHNPRELAEMYIAGELENELMDPRDRELKEVKAKLKKVEEFEKLEKQRAEEKVHLALKEKYAKDYNEQFIAALQESGLPTTKPMVAEMAKYIGRAAKLGFKMTATEASQLVAEDLRVAHQRLIGDSDGEMLIKLLGEEVANKVRKYDVAKLKSPERIATTPKPEDQAEAREARRPGKRLSSAEWRKFNRGY